jgi:alpha-galactosidase
MATSVILMLVLFQTGAPKAAISKSLKPIAGFSSQQTEAGTKFAGVVDFMSPHQLEGGLVTRSELQLAEHWTRAVTLDGKEKSPWLDQWLGTAVPFSFRYGGKESASLLGEWQLQKRERKSDSHADQCEFVWTDAATGLQLHWQVKRFTDYPAVEWVLWFENRGTKDTAVLEDIQDLNLRLNHSRKGEPYIVHGAHGGRYMRDDWWPFSREVPATIAGMPDFVDGREVQLGGTYPASRGDLPFFNLETPENRGLIVGVGWTGNWLSRVKVDGTELTARVGLKETHFVLHPGEQVRTARILLLFWEGKRLHGQNMLRQLLHKHYIPPLRGKLQEPLVSVNVCFTYHGKGEFLAQATEDKVLPLVEPFSRIGAEVFIIDAGWYEGAPWNEWLGDWQYSKIKYPRGFRPISQSLTAANLAFGLWFAPELLSKNAPLLKEHPEWARQASGENPYGNNSRNLLMELPEARDWFLKQVDVLIEKEGMNCYRQDGFNIYSDLNQGEPEDRKGITELKYIMGLYTMVDTLRSRHPDLLMEAAVGAPRIDLEMLSRFHWHQPCETWLDPNRDQCTLYGTNLWLPGGMIVLYTGLTDNYGVWSSFAGQLSLAWHPLDADFPIDLAHRQVERYKRVRTFLSGDFYPLTPISLEETWMGYQFHRADLDKGFALVFKRFDSPHVIYSVNDTFTLKLRGIDPQSRYQLHYEQSNKDQTLTGQALAKGIEIVVGKAPGAELVVYEPAR